MVKLADAGFLRWISMGVAIFQVAMTRAGGLKPPILEMALRKAPLPDYGKAPDVKWPE